MNREDKEKITEYLRYIVGEQKDEWIHPAIASHLRQRFPAIDRSESIRLVKEFISKGDVT